MIKFMLLLVSAMLLAPVSGYALEPPELHGFVQGNFTPRVSGSPDDDFILAEERLQLEAEQFGDALNSRAFFKMDFIHDAVDDEADFELREALVDFSLGKFDFRVGRQIITWGVGDLIFINDAFPKDFSALFSGRPLEYLKIPSDAVRISFFPPAVPPDQERTDIGILRHIVDLVYGSFSVDLVIVPAFERDNLPDGERLLFFDPLAAVPNRTVTEPATELGNTEVALRLQKQVSSYDLSLYVFRGFSKQPGARLISADTVELFFPRLNIYGASAQGPLKGGVGKFEIGYYDSRDDSSGTDPSVENSSFRFLLGYEREWFTDFTVGIQYFGRWMFRYDEYRATLPAGIPAQDELMLMNTLRITYFLLHHTLRLSLFAFLSATDGDFYIIPEVKYSLTDQLSITLGANVFGGEKDFTFFGQLNQNDNIYAIMRYSF